LFQVEQEPENFQVRSLQVRRMRVYTTDLNNLLKPRAGQKCWICRRRKLIPKVSCFEIIVGIDRGSRNGGGSNIIERKKVLVCDYCLENIPELQDAEIVSFGDGVAPPHHYYDESYGSTPEPEYSYGDCVAQIFKD